MRVILVLALIGAAYAVPKQSARIVGGESTTIENYPFMANMLLKFSAEFLPFCGGTLVTETAVVSAAHCFINDPPSSWQVRLGSAFDSFGGNVHTVSRIIPHELFDIRLLIHDIAVVRLANPAVFSNQIKAARIAGANYILPDNTLVHSAGWGALQWEGDYPEVLQHVAVNVINHQICTERYAYLKSVSGNPNMQDVTPEMLCTGILDVGGKDACQGDSGGPVIHAGDILVGVISWGHECAHSMYPGVNVRVSSYPDWIFTNSIN